MRRDMSIATGLQDIKKQASFFLKEKIRTARLALTDVTHVQLLTEESTNGNSSAPDAKPMRLISRAAFEIDDYCRIVPILHRRLAKFEKKQWREPYNSLVLLEHLLTHGHERIADEFQNIKGTAQEMFKWGIVMKKKSEKVLKLLEKGPLFREERECARKISRGIQGFGSFSQNSISNNAIANEKASNFIGRSISLYEDHGYNEKDDEKENSKLSLDDKLNLTSENIESEPFRVPGAGEELKKGISEEGERRIIDHPFAIASFQKETRESQLLLSHG
ncbi:ENTH/VHS family protein [Rhynchospora pubera]|uniref:ENTH/VHS family protein n=1 Tax=Rhynchospora pubera TaxID=906938 RepID=A0AAV8G516_9POAL|nr:ENTH/VHS family protein [Rhynchospora pubera]